MFIVRFIRTRRQRRATARHFRDLAQIKCHRILDQLERDGILTIKES